MIPLGTVRPGSTIEIPFETFAGSTGAPITMTGLAASTTNIKVYKDGSTTERASASGYALLDTDGIDFDGLTGVHGLTIDLSDNTTADFWASGSRYMVVVTALTVDSQTVRFVAATFRIGYVGALLDTTIATLASQTSFTLAAGSADDDAYNGCTLVCHDAASAVQMCLGIVSDYTGSTKTVTLAASPGVFTMAAKDNISILDRTLQPTVPGRSLVVDAAGLADANAVKVGPTGAGTAQTAADLGANTAAIKTKTDFLPSATAGAAGGVFIAGTNAPVTITGSGNALTLSSTGANGAGLATSGNGSGAGTLSTGGTTGHGASFVGGATSGDGVSSAATASGHGLTATGVGTTKHGVNATGGNVSSAGISAVGGGTGNGVTATGGTSGHGAAFTGGSVTGNGIRSASSATGLAGAFLSGTGTGAGLQLLGGSTASGMLSQAGSGGGGHGASFLGVDTGDGIRARSGTGATGNGITALAQSTDGQGVSATGTGTGNGVLATGGASAGGDGLEAVAGGGVAIRGSITGDLLGTVTNLTNAPTAGDLTATMKASVTTAATAATPTAAAVTAAVTVGTNNDKTGYGLSSAAVQAIWDAATSALTTVGSIGKWLLDKLDVTVGSRLPTASYTAPDNSGIASAASSASSAASSASSAAIQATNAAADALLAREIMEGDWVTNPTTFRTTVYRKGTQTVLVAAKQCNKIDGTAVTAAAQRVAGMVQA